MLVKKVSTFRKHFCRLQAENSEIIQQTLGIGSTCKNLCFFFHLTSVAMCFICCGRSFSFWFNGKMFDYFWHLITVQIELQSIFNLNFRFGGNFMFGPGLKNRLQYPKWLSSGGSKKKNRGEGVPIQKKSGVARPQFCRFFLFCEKKIRGGAPPSGSATAR